MKDEYFQLREFLKSTEWVRKAELQTPKDEGKERPPAVKEYDEESEIINLPDKENIQLPDKSLKDLLKKRRSRRKYNNKEFTLEELSFLLWSTQGLSANSIRLRTAPSGGAVHPFETYIYLNKIEEIKEGLYRYLPDKHSLLFIKEVNNPKGEIIKAVNGQKFVGKAGLVFFWSVLPKRGEWKYDILAHKLAALDAGHVCENLYLAVENLEAGMCALDAYNQKEADDFIEVDGQEEFVIYMASVGKVDPSERK